MNTTMQGHNPLLNFLALLGLFVLCVMTAYALATQNLYFAMGVVLGIAFFAIGFLSVRISLYILIFSMLLSPEFGTRDVSGQGFTIRFEDLLLLVMGFAMLAKTAVHKNVALSLYSRLNKPIFIYMVVCLIATLLGIMTGSVKSPLTGLMFVLKYFEYFVVFFLTLNNINSKSQLKTLLAAMFIVYVIVVLLGFSQIPSGRRISAPFEGETGEPNTLGGYLTIMMSLNLTMFLNSREIRYKVFLGVFALLGFIALLYTLSRSSWLAFGAMYLTLVILCNKRKILLLAMVIGLVIAPFTMPQAVVDRLLYTFQKDKDVGVLSQDTLTELEYMYRTGNLQYDSSTQARFNSMRQSLNDFQRRPIFGFGVTGYMFLDAQFHRTLIETGLLGLASLLFLLWTALKSIVGVMKKYKDDDLYRIISLGATASFFGLIVHSIGTNTFIIVRIMEPFWCLVGMCLAIPYIEGAGGEKELKGNDGSIRQNPVRFS